MRGLPLQVIGWEQEKWDITSGLTDFVGAG